MTSATTAAGGGATSPHPIELRCSVVVFRDDRVVLVCHDGPDSHEPVWALPGGHALAGEGLAHCARRELREETGLDVDATALRCVFVLDTVDMDSGRRTVEIVFIPAEESGVPLAGFPTDTEKGLRARLVPLAELSGLVMRPVIAPYLRQLRQADAPASIPYLGTFAGAPPVPVVEADDGTHAR